MHLSNTLVYDNALHCGSEQVATATLQVTPLPTVSLQGHAMVTSHSLAFRNVLPCVVNLLLMMSPIVLFSILQCHE